MLSILIHKSLPLESGARETIYTDPSSMAKDLSSTSNPPPVFSASTSESAPEDPESTLEKSAATPAASDVESLPAHQSHEISTDLVNNMTDANNQLEKQAALHTLGDGGSGPVAECQPDQKKIIYRVICTDIHENPPKAIFRYAWKPFEGLNVGEHAEDKDREELAVVDFVRDLEGWALKKRSTQQRQTFGTAEDKDPDEFIIGVDFLSRVYHHLMVRIFSRHLRQLLSSTVLYYPGLHLEVKEVEITEPFPVIFHYWDDFQHIAETYRSGSRLVKIKNQETGSDIELACDEVTFEHLEVLLGAPPIVQIYTTTVAPERELHSKGLATYNNLWLLFRPGDTVFAREGDKLAGYIIQGVGHYGLNGEKCEPHHARATDRWRLKLWNLAYIDGKLKRQAYWFQIDRYFGEKQINELPVFPVALMNDGGKTKSNLIKRGQRYHNIICNEQCHMRYKGLVMNDNPYHVSFLKQGRRTIS
jgi:hypothetical protein